MAGLTNSEVITDVGAGNETQGANEGSGAVRQDVTVQVGGDNDIVVLGLAEELVDHGVDNLLLDLDGGELLGGRALRAVSRKRPSVCERTLDLWVMVTMGWVRVEGRGRVTDILAARAISPAMAEMRNEHARRCA